MTDLTKGTTSSLGLVGDDAVWSPNGQYIAYHNWGDFFASGWDPNVPVLLNIVPATGGTPVTVRTWAVQASWSNNSRRLAFSEFWYGYIGTIGLDGSETKFDFDTFVSYEGYGCHPAYSPDGDNAPPRPRRRRLAQSMTMSRSGFSPGRAATAPRNGSRR